MPIKDKWYVSEGAEAHRFDGTGIDVANDYKGLHRSIVAGPFDEKAQADHAVTSHPKWNVPCVWQC